MREEGDWRSRNNDQLRYRDEGRGSDCIKFGMRVRIVGFIKKISISHIYVIFQKIIIINKNKNSYQSG